MPLRGIAVVLGPTLTGSLLAIGPASPAVSGRCGTTHSCGGRPVGSAVTAKALCGALEGRAHHVRR
jgi:hypothetical protein